MLEGRAGPSNLVVRVEAPTWESEFVHAEAIADGIEPEDVPDIQSIEVRVDREGRRIAINFAKPPRTSRSAQERFSVVELHVAAPDRQWVSSATTRMKEMVDAGVPRSDRITGFALWASLAVFVLGLFVVLIARASGGDENSAVAAAGVWLLIIGGALIVVVAMTLAFLPSLELVAEGHQPRRFRFMRLARREGISLVRATVIAVVSGAVAIMIDRYFR